MIKRIAVWSTLLLLALALAVPAQAGLFTYRLNGGVNGRYYYIDPNILNPTKYTSLIQNAVSSWNGNGTSISFSQTTNYNSSAVDYYVKDYGNTNWRGVVGYFHSDGSQAMPNLGDAPTSNYDYAEASLNNSYLSSDSSDLRSRSTAAHEFGHAVALSHSSVTSALMYYSISRYDTYGVYTPQQNDDITYASQL